MVKIKGKKTHTKTALSKRKREETIGLLLIVLGVLILIALSTYESKEVPRDVIIGQVSNALGIAGVYLSYYLIRYTIGYPIYILPFLIVLWGWNRLKGKEYYQLARWSGYTLLFALYVSISGVLLSGGSDIVTSQNSGYVGTFLAGVLIRFLGNFGAVVMLLGLLMITVLMATEISYAHIYDRVASFFTRIFEGIRNFYNHMREMRLKRRQQLIFLNKSRERDVKIKAEILTKQKHVAIPLPRPKERHARVTAEQLDLNLGQPETQVNNDSADSDMDSSSVDYLFPSLDILQAPPISEEALDRETLFQNAQLLESKLADFGVNGKVVEVNPGPVITRYEIEPAAGVKVSRFTSLADDLAMVMRAKRVRVVAPIPGKAVVGIEIPNPSPSTVYLREIISSEAFENSKSCLTIALGKTISGKPYVTDLRTMPHLLVAGSTGSGKSVCINTIITSILFNAHPKDVQFVLIDPKRLELSVYAPLKHHYLTYLEGLNEYVATNPTNAIAVLRGLEVVMEKRYELLAGAGVRNIEEYNERIKDGLLPPGEDDQEEKPLPYLILVIDELADLMIASAQEVEEPIARLTQMSRAVGIHLIVATQRPSVDVITGVIKANFPARIAFQVASKVDSRTILDMNGAEKLLGRGDMLFLPPASPEPIRIHTAFISGNEIESVIKHICAQPKFPKSTLPSWEAETQEGRGIEGVSGSRDPLFKEALKLVVRHQQGSVSLLQRRLKVGYSRAARLIDELEDAGIVGPFEGSKAREVLVSEEELEELGLVGSKHMDDFDDNA